MASLLGRTVVDQITGFRGVVTGEVKYVTGCNQVLVTPRCKEDGTAQDARWFDVDRVTVDVDVAPVVIRVTASGPDLPAPIR